MKDLRIIALIDVDSFECQIYQKECPQWKNKPWVVANISGRIVSVSYEAKKLGVTRNHRVKDLKKAKRFRSVEVFEKPQKNNKPDSTKCREASLEITDVITKFCYKRNITVERVPNDEWFLDLTDCVNFLAERHGTNSYSRFKNQTVYLESKKTCNQNSLEKKLNRLANEFDFFTEEEKLVIGASVVTKLCKVIFNETEFSCSAGVSFNKLLAKQACKLHNPEPNRLIILSSSGLKRVSKFISVSDIWGLGGGLGNDVEEKLPNVKTMADLKIFNERKLMELFGEENGTLLYEKARGICYEKVISKITQGTVNCSKANLKIKNCKDLRFYLKQLSQDMVDNRLEEEKSRHNRYTKRLKIQFSYYHENDDDDSEEKSVEITFDYNGENYSWVAKRCSVKIWGWGFRRFKHYNYVISKLKLTAKKFLFYK